MDMGTGKTKVSIDSFCYLYDQGKINSVLVIAPKGVYMNWYDIELGKHIPDHIVYESAYWTSAPRASERDALNSLFVYKERLRILVMNIEALSTQKGTLFAKKFLDTSIGSMFVVDESTTIKNMSAKRTKNILKLGKSATYRRILTGEPVTNSPMDLYSQCYFLDPHLLGFQSFFAFRNRYAEMIDMRMGSRAFKKVVGYRNLDELTTALKTFSTRIKKDECLDLPPKIYVERTVELTPEQKRAYDDMKHAALMFIDEQPKVTAQIVLTKLLRLHQIVCGHIITDEGDLIEIPEKRIEEVLNVAEETSGKIIIWANYRHSIRALVQRLEKTYGAESVVSYFGDTEQEDRRAAVSSFQDDPKVRFFVGNPQTGGFGITLTAASTVIYFSNDYSLERRLQSEDRCHRIGQTKSVTYVDIRVPGTIDDKILKALKEKKDLAATIMGDPDPKRALRNLLT
jgi:SNF2 family DNA or RNA helicase